MRKSIDELKPIADSLQKQTNAEAFIILFQDQDGDMHVVGQGFSEERLAVIFSQKFFSSLREGMVKAHPQEESFPE